jgi:hypothetical protein
LRQAQEVLDLVEKFPLPAPSHPRTLWLDFFTMKSQVCPETMLL